jgi:hypothetical protein
MLTIQHIIINSQQLICTAFNTTLSIKNWANRDMPLVLQRTGLRYHTNKDAEDNQLAKDKLHARWDYTPFQERNCV